MIRENICAEYVLTQSFASFCSATLCWRGICLHRVSVRASVRLSQAGIETSKRTELVIDTDASFHLLYVCALRKFGYRQN